MKRPSTMLVLMVAALTLSGCKIFRGGCEVPPTPEEAATIAFLNVPAGLEAPDTRNALRIPELKEPERPPRGEGARCLEQPPAFTPGWQPAAPPPEDKAAPAVEGQPATDAEKAQPKKKRKQ